MPGMMPADSDSFRMMTVNGSPTTSDQPNMRSVSCSCHGGSSRQPSPVCHAPSRRQARAQGPARAAGAGRRGPSARAATAAAQPTRRSSQPRRPFARQARAAGTKKNRACTGAGHTGRAAQAPRRSPCTSSPALQRPPGWAQVCMARRAGARCRGRPDGVSDTQAPRTSRCRLAARCSMLSSGWAAVSRGFMARRRAPRLGDRPGSVIRQLARRAPGAACRNPARAQAPARPLPRLLQTASIEPGSPGPLRHPQHARMPRPTSSAWCPGGSCPVKQAPSQQPGLLAAGKRLCFSQARWGGLGCQPTC